MCKPVRETLNSLILNLFPRPASGTADEFAAKEASDPQAVKAVEECERAIRTSTDEITGVLVEHARAKLAREDDRQASVIGRAQNLFFVVALLSSLLTFGASLLTAASAPPRTELFVIAAIAMALLLQIYFLVRNVLKAIEGIGYTRAGTSDITRWARQRQVGDVYRDEAIETLKWYREASRKNSWRFKCLHRAIKALRNIVFCACALVTTFLWFVVSAHAPCANRVQFTVDGAPVYSVQTPCASR
jgi:hypothetical protein